MPTVTVVYVHVPGDHRYEALGRRYVETALAHPPGHACRHLVVCQGGPVRHGLFADLAALGEVGFHEHDNSGWDIGAFIAGAAHISDDIVVCMGGSAYVRRAGWLARMVEVWDVAGPGLYGSLSSYEGRPHLNTTGFWCAPAMLQRYPLPVRRLSDRYAFEHGEFAWWRRLELEGVTVRLATWDGIYEWPQWRTPPDISCRGTQANCLTYFRVNDEYDEHARHDPGERQRLEARVDGRVDPRWAQAEALDAAGSHDAAALIYVELSRQPGRDGGLATYRLGSVCERQGRFGDAASAFVRITGAPTLPVEWRAGAAFHLGRIAEAEGDRSNALARYRDAVRLVPSHRAAWSAIDRLSVMPAIAHFGR